MALDIYISESTQTALAEVVDSLVAHCQQKEGEVYSAEVMQKAVLSWFEATLEDLAEDALYHCVEGDRSFAVGRHHFENAMQLAHPISAPAIAPDIAA